MSSAGNLTPEIHTVVPTIQTGWDAVVAAFREFHHEPDIQAIEATLGAAVAHQLSGQPVWIFCIAPASSGKTELLMTLKEVRALIVANVTPRTFLSGWTDKRTGQDGSLLTRIGSSGIIVCKDFSQLLSTPHRQRGPVLADLRDIYDGYIAKEYGAGGRKEWSGRITFIAGVTPEIDRHYSIYQTLGERFVQVRWKRAGGVDAALRAMVDEAGEARQRVRESVRDLLGPIMQAQVGVGAGLSEPQRQQIAHLAEFTVLARTHVPRDGHSRDMSYMPEPEAAPRLAQQLMQLARGLAVLHGRTETDAHDIGVVKRVAFDCIPVARRCILELLISKTEPVSNADIESATRLNRSLVSRQLAELYGLRLLDRSQAQNFKSGSNWMSPLARQLLRVALR